MLMKMKNWSHRHDINTVNSLINGHANQRTALVNGRIHFPQRIAGQTLIDDALKSGQAIRGLSF